LPEAFGVVDGGVGGCLPLQGGLVDVAKSVEGLAFIWVRGVFYGAQVCGEEFLVFGDVVLGDHVLHGGLDWAGGHGVDTAPGETEQAVRGVLLELRGEGVG